MSIQLSHYSGAYGPTLRIGAQCAADLMALRELFESLATGTAHVIDLSRELPCERDQVVSLLLATRESEAPERLVRVGGGRSGQAFEWIGSREEWEERTSKIDALLSLGEPSHQYLSLEGIDDALVELSLLAG